MSNIVSVTGTIKTGPPSQESGGDFYVLVRQSEFNAAMEKDEAVLIVAYSSGPNFAPMAGATFYRYLVVEGVVFQIVEIGGQTNAIRLVVRLDTEDGSTAYLE